MNKILHFQFIITQMLPPLGNFLRLPIQDLPSSDSLVSTSLIASCILLGLLGSPIPKTNSLQAGIMSYLLESISQGFWHRV